MSELIHYLGVRTYTLYRVSELIHYTECLNKYTIQVVRTYTLYGVSKLILYTGLQTYTLYRVSELRYCLGWEFAHWFSEQIARFFQKNERKSYLLKKTRDSLIFGN